MNRKKEPETVLSLRNLSLAVMAGVICIGIYWLVSGFSYQSFIPAIGSCDDSARRSNDTESASTCKAVMIVKTQ